MFSPPRLLVSLQIDYALEPRNPVKIQSRLKCLPRDPTVAYRSVLERMTDDQRADAVTILRWVLHAQRILRMDELQAAFAAIPFDLDEPDTMEPTPAEYLASPETILEICGGLIDHSKETQLVTFSHALVRQFLEQNIPDLNPAKSHASLALNCLAYLYSVYPSLNDYHGKLLRLPLNFHLLGYAACCWEDHAIASERNPDVEAAILELFKTQERRDAINRLLIYGFGLLGCSFPQMLIFNGLAHILLYPKASNKRIADTYLLSIPFQVLR